MAKGRIKELLFDINNNSLMELDENGNPIDHSGKTGDELLDVLLDSEEIARDKIKKDKDDIKEEKEAAQEAESKETVEEPAQEPQDPSEDYEVLSKEARETLAEGKEKFDEMVAIGVEKVNETVKHTKKMTKKASKKAAKKAKKASQKAAEMTKNAAEKAKPIAEATGTAIKNSTSAIADGTKKKIDKAQKDIQKHGWKQFLLDNRITVALALCVVLIGGGIYLYNYKKLPTLGRTHLESSGANYKKLDVKMHPMEILSLDRANLKALLGEPGGSGDGKKAETRYDTFTANWFGKERKGWFFYNKDNLYERIKLQIADQSGQQLFDKLKEQLGTPMEDKDPSKKEGYAVWIKDAVHYKLMHHGKYATITMTPAKYDNPSKLALGKNPLMIQYINNLDLNGDGKIDEKIVLLGNKVEGLTSRFEKLYLLIWDGKKTYLKEMDPDYDGGSYPQINFANTDNERDEEIVISADNNVVDNYNVFKYTGDDVTLIYKGYDSPIKKIEEQEEQKGNEQEGNPKN
ncbi:MAG: hypothetical protein Q4D65_03325 [Peptostreptococcaceae bacterium]|nr:hypothetical protein [Peptostreptococcaceae bacterium]